MAATKVKLRNRKLDWSALRKDVAENPEARLIDRAKKFRVRPSAISHAFKQMKITRKSGATPRPKGYRSNTVRLSEKYELMGEFVI